MSGATAFHGGGSENPGNQKPLALMTPSKGLTATGHTRPPPSEALLEGLPGGPVHSVLPVQGHGFSPRSGSWTPCATTKSSHPTTILQYNQTDK